MFRDYLDPNLSLEERLSEAFDELSLSNDQRRLLKVFLATLKQKETATFEHSIRVGLIARRIARFLHLDEKALFYAGLMHDIGKTLTPLDTLKKTEKWTDLDQEKIESHVTDGFKLLKGQFDFTAEIVKNHHKFQKGGYPKKTLPFLHEYSEGTSAMIVWYGRVLALADTYDALHRVNDKFGPLSGLDIKKKILSLNPDQKSLIEKLYDLGILSAYLMGDEKKIPILDKHDKLYDQIWDNLSKNRTPRETARHVMLASVVEPISDKSGCVTRSIDLSEFQKLEYFIIGGINIGDAFEALAEEVYENKKQPNLIYHHIFRAQKESKRNRRGGRVNQGIIELLTPIVVSQYVNDPARTLSLKDLLDGAVTVLKKTTKDDISFLVKMKRFAFDLSGYYDRVVSRYSDANNVYEYYSKELATSKKQTSIAHNGEFVNGFPTIQTIYDSLTSSPLPQFNNKVEEAYQKARLKHHREVASGFLADCIAVAIYLMLSQNPKIKL